MESNPAWTEDVSFMYRTKHPNALGIKKLHLTVQSVSSGFFSSSVRDWGSVQIDLLTLATGPVKHHNLRVLDGSKPNGTLSFCVEMQEVVDAIVNLADVKLSGVPAADAGGATLQYAFTGHDNYTERTVESTQGGPHFQYLPQLRLRTYFAQFTESHVHMWVQGGGYTVASCRIPCRNTPLFTEGKPHSFVVPLYSVDGQNMQVGSLTGRLWYTGCPRFLQMVGGYHTDGGIYGAAVAIPGLKDKPRCYIQPAQGQHQLQAGGGAGGGSSMASIGAAVMSSGGHRTGRAAGAAGSGTHWGHTNTPQGGAAGMSGYAVSRARAAAAGIRGGSGAAGTPSTGQLGAAIARAAMENKLGTRGSAADGPSGAVVTLPHCWDRRTDPRTGAAYFYNSVTGESTWELPTAAEFEVTLSHAGPLGLELGHNWSGKQQQGHPSGRRHSGQDRGAVVKSVPKGGQASMVTSPCRIQTGMHLVAINRGSTLQWGLATTLDVLRRSGRPVLLTFENPYAVPPAVAAAARNASNKVSSGDKPAVRYAYESGGGAGGGAAAGSGAAASVDSDEGDSKLKDLDEKLMWVEQQDRISGRTFWVSNATGAVSFTRPVGV